MFRNREDQDLLESIRKDAARTYPEVEMFSLLETKSAITRVLYTYGKLNGGVKYIQVILCIAFVVIVICVVSF